MAATAVTLLAGLPFLFAWLTTPADRFYTGLFVNPFDNHSYLAKMRQGAGGHWLFILPFTPEPHPGAFLFVFYLLLGHLARWFALPLIVTYHLARSLMGLLLLAVAYRLIAEFVAGLHARRLAFWIVALSSGLGWLASVTGVTSPDLWVPESNTFFSILANPHFPLGEALMALIILLATTTSRPALRNLLMLAGLGVALALVMPFAMPTVLATLATYLTAKRVLERSRDWHAWLSMAVVGVAAAPVLAYDGWVYTHEPAFAAWSAQNLTPAPPPWLVMIGYGFLLPLAGLGVVWCVVRRQALLLVVWVVVNLALVYAPLDLQRRLLIGLHLPIAILAALGWLAYVQPWASARRGPFAASMIVVLALSNVMLLMTGMVSSNQRSWPLYMTADMRSALAWLETNTQPQEIVLASPQTGLWIPAWAGNRVVYGHPMETIAATEKKAEVETFFREGGTNLSLVDRYSVNYLWLGPLERQLGGADPTDASRFALAYANADVKIYRVLRRHVRP